MSRTVIFILATTAIIAWFALTSDAFVSKNLRNKNNNKSFESLTFNEKVELTYKELRNDAARVEVFRTSFREFAQNIKSSRFDKRIFLCNTKVNSVYEFSDCFSNPDIYFQYQFPEELM